MTKPTIKIDIVTDINCPWCYLGEQRLKSAMEAAADRYHFEVATKPYELSPNAPAEGESKEAYFIKNYGAAALPRLNDSSQQLAQMGKAEGIIFDWQKATRIHNTFNAHRLLWLAKDYGVQKAVADALYKANFTDGSNVNDVDVLLEIGQANGIPSQRLQGFFESEEGKQEVRQLEAWAQRSGISGVPAFIFNQQYLVSGAQPAETFTQVFEQLAPSLQALQGEDGPSCGPDGIC
ncbi:DsbA family oxidoreductase [Cesiribacter andamanensis]|uniref:Protein-disulfide isomerase n=1 Tax=Cesiribacter andamanensis AMV16 TaxID=1279009 RepID=M7N1V3_9BACT|nr:DsbA family oxidoreductase [Cesiribacter andamanensis]EMR01201.1 Protein-disulfide isomerase [Cesiribacter andamanensis AMV16]